MKYYHNLKNEEKTTETQGRKTRSNTLFGILVFLFGNRVPRTCDLRCFMKPKFFVWKILLQNHLSFLFGSSTLEISPQNTVQVFFKMNRKSLSHIWFLSCSGSFWVRTFWYQKFLTNRKQLLKAKKTNREQKTEKVAVLPCYPVFVSFCDNGTSFMWPEVHFEHCNLPVRIYYCQIISTLLFDSSIFGNIT